MAKNTGYSLRYLPGKTKRSKGTLEVLLNDKVVHRSPTKPGFSPGSMYFVPYCCPPGGPNFPDPCTKKPTDGFCPPDTVEVWLF